MNIIWILTDGICNYERSGDSFGITPAYKKLKEENEGFYFNNAITSFGSTVFSLFSMFTGRFPAYVFPDYYTSISFLPEFENAHHMKYLKDNGYSINSILHWQEGCNIYREILNPYYKEGIFIGERMIESNEMYELFLEQVKKCETSDNNFLYVHYRPADPNMDKYVQKTIDYLKKSELWDKSIIIINSDHGYSDNWKWYKRMNLLHFDDLSRFTLNAVLYMKFPKNISSVKPRIIDKRVYLMDIMETILDYLEIKPSHERESISFKKIIEDDIDINKNRIVRSDCYLLFQPIIKTAILKGKWNLYIETYNKFLYNLDEHKLEYIKKKWLYLKIPKRIDYKDKFPEIFNELNNNYLETEKKVYIIASKYVEFYFKQSELSKLKNKLVFIPPQFPPTLVSMLKENLSINNKILSSHELLREKSKGEIVIILIFNRLTGYGLKKLIRKYKKFSQDFIIIDTQLKNAENKLNQLGYWNYVKRTYKARDRQIFQRWREVITFIFYFPAYLNKSIKKYY